MIKNIPKPIDLIKIGLENYEVSISARSISGLTNDSVSKATVSKILNGDLSPKITAFLEIGACLNLNQNELKASYYWHRLEREVQISLIQKIRKNSNFNIPRDYSTEFAPLIKWAFDDASIEYDKGHIFMKHKSYAIYYLFIFPEEFEDDKHFDSFLETNSEKANKAASIKIIDTQPEDENYKEIISNKISQHYEHRPTDSIFDSTSTIEKTYTVCRLDELVNFINEMRFDPKDYCQQKYYELDENFRSFKYAKLKLQINSSKKQVKKSDNALKYLQEWTKGDDNSIFLLQGSYGSGKTTVVKLLTKWLSKQIVDSEKQPKKYDKYNVPIPIIAPVNLWLNKEGENPLFTFIVEYLSQPKNKFGISRPPDGLNLEIFEKLVLNRNLFIIFIDGLDENIRSNNQLRRVFDSIRKLNNLGIKVIISTRPELFRRKNELNEYIADNNIVTANLIPLETDEIKKYINLISKKGDLKNEVLLGLFKEYPKVFQIPLFLSHICNESDSRLSELNMSLKEKIEYDLFKFFTDEWLEREEHRTNKRIKNLIKFIEEIAIEISHRKDNCVSDQNLPILAKHVLNEIGEIGDTLSGQADEHYQREARVCSFMTIDDFEGSRIFSFKLRPFGSFFIASRIISEIQADTRVSDSSLGKVLLSFSDIKMICSGISSLGLITKAQEYLKKLIHKTQNSFYCRHWPYRYLGGNALSILLTTEEGIAIDLIGVSICGFKVTNKELKGNWSCVDMSESTIQNCNLSQLNGSYIYVFQSTINGVDFSLDNSIIEFSSMKNQDLKKMELNGFEYIKAKKIEKFHHLRRPFKLHAHFIKKTRITNSSMEEYISINDFWHTSNIHKIAERMDSEFSFPTGSTKHYLKNINESESSVSYAPKMLMESYAEKNAGRLPSEMELYQFLKSSSVQFDGHELCGDCYWDTIDKVFEFISNDEINLFLRPLNIPDGTNYGKVSKKIGTKLGKENESIKISRNPYILSNYDADVYFRIVIDIHIGMARIFNQEPLVELKHT